MKIRTSDPARDGEAVAAIYRPAVDGSHISFEEEVPSPEEMQRRIQTTIERTPWLVAEVEGEVIGYAYATSHRERPAYRWSVDISAYLAAEWQGRGIGRALYEALLTILREQVFHNAYAGVALPNPASVGLHEAIGMKPIGVYREVGYKLGNWWDVMWLGMRLGQPSGQVIEPIPLPLLDRV